MKLLLMFVFYLFVTACSTSLSDYEGGQPELELDVFFDGDMVAYGVVQNYSSRLTRHFCVDISGTWTQTPDGQLKGTLVERFYYDDGETQDRIWELVKSADSNEYVGNAGDVIGEAKGEVIGNVLNWKYKLDVPIKNKKGEVRNIVFNVDDWIYLLTKDRAYNRSALKKYGITLAEVTIFFDKTKAKCNEKS